MKKSIIYVLLLSAFFSYAQKKLTISQALNIASKQSMLCERLAKEKTFKATNHETEHKLRASLIQFEQNIDLLKEMNLTDDILSKIITVEMLWIGYKQTILSEEKSSVVKTIRFNEVMLSHCNNIFKSILTLSEIKNAYPYNSKVIEFPDAYVASNNLKYLSQQLSLNYNAYYSKLVAYDSQKFNNILSQIDKSIVNITKIEDTDTEIKTKTQEIKTQWDDLKAVTKKVIQTNFSNISNYPKPEYILNESNKILKNTDLLTRLYKANSDIN